MCELATATHTLPSQWAMEDPQSIATVMEILDERAREAAKG